MAHQDHRYFIIKTLKTKSTSTTNPITAGNILETIQIQTENEPTLIYVYICIYSPVVLMIDYRLSVNEGSTCNMML